MGNTQLSINDNNTHGPVDPVNIEDTCFVSTESDSSGLRWSQLSYTVLGLGDTNYTNFCNFSKNLDEKLHALGAKR